MCMRPFTTFPLSLAVVVAASCGHEARVASPAAGVPPPPSPAPATAVAAPFNIPGNAEGDRLATGTTPLTPPSPNEPNAPPTSPEPIDARLPSSEGLTLSNKASCPAKTCRLEGSRLQALLGSPESRSPAGLWEEDIADGAAVTFARRTDMDVLGVALSGTIAVSTDDLKAGPELLPWHAFAAPGSGLTLRAKGGPARIVLIVVTAGNAAAAKVAALKSNAWTTRPAPLAFVDLATTNDLTWGQGAYHARIGFAGDASPRASLGVLRMAAQANVAAHEHPNEWEHMAVLQGEGDFVQGTGADERTLHAAEGAMFSVPPATRHEWRSTGTRPFLGIQVYTPPGPEQRFKKLASPP